MGTTLPDLIFRSVAEATSVGVLVTDNRLEGNPIVYANPYFQKLTGYRADEIVGKNCRFLQGPGSDKNVIAQIRQAVESGVDFCGDILNYRKDGSSFWNHLTISPVRNTDNKIIYFVGIQQDVTSQKIAEERLSAIVDATSDVIYFADTKGDSSNENVSWSRFTGQTENDMRAGGWIHAVHPQDQSTVFAAVSRALSEGKPYQVENRLRRFDGDWRYMLVRGVPLLDSQGAVREWVGACQDITDRKQMEIDLSAALSQREDMLSIAAHEIKSPFTMLKFQIEQICGEVDGKTDPVSSAIAPRAKRALKAAQTAVSLVNELLDIGRIRAGKLFLDRKRVDLKVLIEHAVDQMAEDAAKSGCQIDIFIEQPIFGHWDEGRINQVVSNLLSNAIKYGPEKPIAIRAYMDKSSNRARIEVEDRGLGIPTEKQELIFERFERAVSDSGTYGLGLGLYIVKQIVDAHGGTIRVNSELGKGAVFIVELPLEEKLLAERGGFEPP